MSFFGGVGNRPSSTFGSANSISNESKDVECADPPSDSISSLAFSTAGEFMAVGSWNNEVWLTFLISELVELRSGERMNWTGVN